MAKTKLKREAVSRGNRKNGKKKRRSRLGYIALGTVFLIGLGVLCYPTVSNLFNARFQTRAILEYSDAVSNLTEEDYTQYFDDATAFNQQLLQRGNVFALSEEERGEYDQLLNIGGSGAMGYIEIPAISVSLPIYHTTEDEILEKAVGHLVWTSLPVGGESTHAVLSGHRGLPSAKLFSELDRMAVGDLFMIRILNEVLTYEVDQILIVLPDEISALQVTPGMDYVTLLTCTPYGVNTHRLLVRGHRVENVDDGSAVRVTSEAVQIDEIVVAPFVAVPLVAAAGILIHLDDNAKKRQERLKNFENEINPLPTRPEQKRGKNTHP